MEDNNFVCPSSTALFEFSFDADKFIGVNSKYQWYAFTYANDAYSCPASMDDTL